MVDFNSYNFEKNANIASADVSSWIVSYDTSRPFHYVSNRNNTQFFDVVPSDFPITSYFTAKNYDSSISPLRIIDSSDISEDQKKNFFLNPDSLLNDLKTSIDLLENANEYQRIFANSNEFLRNAEIVDVPIYYDAVRSMLSNAFVRASNVRNTRFKILKTIDFHGQLLKKAAEYESICYLNPERINCNSGENSYLKNSNYSPKYSSMYGDYRHLLGMLADGTPYKNIISNGNIARTPLGEEVINADNGMGNARCVDVVRLCDAYISALNEIRISGWAEFRDSRLTGDLDTTVVYHKYNSRISSYFDSNVAFIDPTARKYDFYTISSYFSLFAFESDTDKFISANFLGWSMDEPTGETVSHRNGDEILIQDENTIHFYPVIDNFYTLTYNWNDKNWLSSVKENTLITFDPATVLEFGVVDGNARSIDIPEDYRTTHSLFYENETLMTILSSHFKGYNTNRNASSGYSIGSKVSISKNITLYPIYKLSYRFSLNGVKYFHKKYGKGGSFTYDGPSWKFDINSSKYLGNELYKLVSKVRFKFVGTINEKSHTHSCKVTITIKNGTYTVANQYELYHYSTGNKWSVHRLTDIPASQVEKQVGVWTKWFDLPNPVRSTITVQNVQVVGKTKHDSQASEGYIGLIEMEFK